MKGRRPVFGTIAYTDVAMAFPRIKTQTLLITAMSVSFGLLSGWGLAHLVSKTSSQTSNSIAESPLDSDPSQIWSQVDDAPMNSSISVLPTVGHADDAEMLWSQIESSNASPNRIDVPEDAAPLPAQ